MKISVIIPVYMVEKYLRRCLDSVANQTFDLWEAICVNDGSTDNCPSILREYAAADSRFKVIDKANGGLSDARNVGMQHATGDYIMFLDSDDLIHPQTMEVASILAQRDNSDMVTWYKDKYFRPTFLLRRYFGLNTDSALPRNINHRFDVEEIKSLYTDDIFAHAYESAPKSTTWAVKRCYVWKALYRRELIEGIDFIGGLKYEDFPWWSALLLKNPTTTITRLPFYYYFPNPTSIIMSTDRLDKMLHRIKGIVAAYRLYTRNADSYQMSCWTKHFLLPTIDSHICKKLRLIVDKQERQTLREALGEFRRLGIIEAAASTEFADTARRLNAFLAS